jgi:hypothetical protein
MMPGFKTSGTDERSTYLCGSLFLDIVKKCQEKDEIPG